MSHESVVDDLPLVTQWSECGGREQAVTHMSRSLTPDNYHLYSLYNPLGDADLHIDLLLNNSCYGTRANFGFSMEADWATEGIERRNPSHYVILIGGIFRRWK